MDRRFLFDGQHYSLLFQSSSYCKIMEDRGFAKMPSHVTATFSFSIFLTAVKFALLQVALFYGVKYILTYLDPMRNSRDQSKLKAKERLSALNVKKINLNEHEEVIATELILTEDIKVTFEDIGGLEGVVSSVKQAVLYPLQFPGIFSGNAGLLSPPRGVLLYGPPGCGKTMLAKAIAKESGASFINLRISTLTEKWFGESQKLVKAVFTLARKIQPTIIFIDEIDSFLRSRQTSDHEVTAMMKAEFMSLWDGLTTDDDARIVILGATNRPLDIDQAILRRMPKKFHIPLPSKQQRASILRLTLKEVKVENDFPFEDIAYQTEGFSGSDLKELCRNAAMAPIQEYMKSQEGNLASLGSLSKEDISLRTVVADDFYKQEGLRNPKRRQETASPVSFEDAMD